MNTRHLTLPLALALALAAPRVDALGLGPLQVKSGLNQPLLAEIPIIAASPDELDQLSVRLASPDAFARVGLDRPIELTANLQFSVGKNARGQPVILVSTSNKFTEPFLSFLIEADWGKSSVTREYTALVDPPYIATAVIHPMQAPATTRVATAPSADPEVSAAPMEAQTRAVGEPDPVVVESTIPEPSVPAPPVAVTEPARAPTTPAGHYGPVESGQTLSDVAHLLRTDRSVSVNQMMVALLRANPEAFIQDNINRLKRGAVLRIPARNEVARLSAADATALVHEQISAWRLSRAPIPQPAERLAHSGDARPPRPAVAAAAPAVASGKSAARLEIVPPSGKVAASGAQSGAAAGAGGAELRAELVQAREELAVRSSEVADLKSRLNDLESINEQRQKMIAVQSSELKALQDRLKQIEDEKAAAASTVAAAPVPALTAIARGDTAPAPVAASAASPTPVTPAPGTGNGPWYFNPYLLGGAILVLLGGLVLVMRGSKTSVGAREFAPRRLSDDEALRASLSSARNESEAALVSARAESPEVIDTLDDRAPAEPARPVDSRLQALNDAIDDRPHDLEAHLNRLRYLHGRGDAQGYDAAARVMHAQVQDTLDPRWREAVLLGAAMLPGHPLFGQMGWNAPRFSDHDTTARETAPVAADIQAELARFNDADADVAEGDAVESASADVLAWSDQPDTGAVGFGPDSDRSESDTPGEDDASATRIELAKAYLDIGDLDGAQSMLEDVLADGSPAAKAEAERILKELG